GRVHRRAPGRRRGEEEVSAPAGIYVHIPFCLTRCGYCDFNAYAGMDELKPRYLAALFREAELASPGWTGTEFVSVFLGGGTPTTLEAADLRVLLAHLRDRYSLTADAETTTEALAEAGYGHYEISNWARPGFECVHNLGYWERRPYLGLGAGAHAYRDDVRWWNVRPPETYMEKVEAGELPIGGSESLDPSDAYLEEVFLKLRILEGVPSSWFDHQRYEPYVQSGLLVDDLGQLVPTERGMLLLNELVLGLTG